MIQLQDINFGTLITFRTSNKKFITPELNATNIALKALHEGALAIPFVRLLDELVNDRHQMESVQYREAVKRFAEKYDLEYKEHVF